MSKNHAFSLVELSIVLVILGLLTGGILAGQSLIRAAELRSVSTEYSRYTTAIQTFRDKYFALPGDMPNATAFWGKDDYLCNLDSGTASATGTCNGNGSGIIDIETTARSEIYAAWQHLALAGLIEGTYAGKTTILDESYIGINVPKSKVNNAGWTIYFLANVDSSDTILFEGSYGNVFLFGSGSYNGELTWGAALKPEEAWNIDTKLDDSKPGTGLVRIRKYQSGCYTNGPSASSATYALTTTSLECGLIINL
jgi:prepilin-type N-terminal cleavage/methylation domain-containing protein